MKKRRETSNGETATGDTPTPGRPDIPTPPPVRRGDTSRAAGDPIPIRTVTGLIEALQNLLLEEIQPDAIIIFDGHACRDCTPTIEEAVAQSQSVVVLR